MDKLKDGDVIRVNPDCKAYGAKLAGRVGRVRMTYPDADRPYAVAFPGYANNRSGYGYFYLKASDLTQIDADVLDDTEREEKVMISGYMAVSVSFMEGEHNDVISDKVYTYAAYPEVWDRLEVGDLVVVKTGHHGMSLARVVGIPEDQNEARKAVTCNRQIVDIVDATAFEDRQSRVQRARELKKEMDRRVKELQKTAIYEMMAEKDPSLAAALEEFKALGSMTEGD